MHEQARQGFEWAMRCGPGGFDPQSVLDLGGADVNGTVHDFLRAEHPSIERIVVVDIADGPGVDVIADARDLDFGNPNTYWAVQGGDVPLDVYDLVMSTEALEHIHDWPRVISTAYRAVAPGGRFVGTCASDGRPWHGARGAAAPEDGEHYGNVSRDDLVSVLSFEGFTDIYTWYRASPGDLYWSAAEGGNR